MVIKGVKELLQDKFLCLQIALYIWVLLWDEGLLYSVHLELSFALYVKILEGLPYDMLSFFVHCTNHRIKELLIVDDSVFILVKHLEGNADFVVVEAQSKVLLGRGELIFA